MEILGLPVPDAGPLFLAALTVHILAGLTCVSCGAMTALSPKGGSRHVRFGRIYLWGLVVLFTTLTIMSVIRWQANAHLFAIGSATAVAGLTGYLNRRRHQLVHIAGMGLSYIGLLTGFYVDNGPNLPLWEHLPSWSYWLLPGLIGIPLTARAIWRRRATSRSGVWSGRARR